MERSGLLRWLLLGLVVFLSFTFLPKLFGQGETEVQPLSFEGDKVHKSGQAEKVCDLFGERFHAQVSTRGASLKHYYLTTAKYQKHGTPIDLSTTPDAPLRRQLRFHWRNFAALDAKAEWQLDYDLVDFKLEKSDGKSCSFSYRDDKVELTRVIAVSERPYELTATATIKNLSKKKLPHALSVHTVAWRNHAEVKGHMFRVSPFVTHVECIQDAGSAKRMQEGDFEKSDFEDKEFAKNQVNPGDWYQAPGATDFAAVSNAYFSHALVPGKSKVTPVCQLQIEEWGHKDDPKSGAMYRARLAYPKVELAPGESATYQLSSYVGPKERDVLAAAAGGDKHLTELIDLGFFSAIAKVLVSFLMAVHGVLPNWGIAIILLTITARVLLFPLSVPGVKSAIKMRELKPELDAMNEKYKDDPQQKGLAQMELWRKHNVNPFKGCLPQLASMPVWFALYTTLQTAVELYNIPFLWFPDLSEPDHFYILPFVIGATSYFQQRLMPMQGDAMQQKMMLYLMPGMFTVFMLFLPAGLGVYMFTNGLLTIAQQQIVEWHVRRSTGISGTAGQGPATIDVKIKEESKKGSKSKKSKSDGSGPDKKSGGKGAGGNDPKLLDDGLLGKGKA